MKDLRSVVLEHHPDWIVPERRLQKYVKKVVSSSQPDPSVTEEDPSLTSPVSASGKPSATKRFVKLFSLHRRTPSATSSIPVDVVDDEALPEAAPESSIPVSTELSMEEEGEAEAEEEEPAAAVVTDRNLDGPYLTDDNDGKKNGCNCGSDGSTGGCTIM